METPIDTPPVSAESDNVSLNPTGEFPSEQEKPVRKYRGKVKPGLSVLQKFWKRMEREGRKHLWAPQFKKIMAETGLKYGAAKWEAARQLGYETPENEHRLYKEWLEQEAKAKADAEQKIRDDEAARLKAEQDKLAEEQRAAMDFEKACVALPDEAPVPVEIKWIRAHPAMSRRDRNPSERAILITPDDILRPPHGPAPSKSAVAQLQHWVNEPREFFKALLSEHKKITGETGQVKAEEDVEMAEVERMIKEMGSA